MIARSPFESAPFESAPLADLAARDIYSVGNLVANLRDLLESNFRDIWVEGELTNLAQPASGHCYFSLTEGKAVIRCALFAQRRRQLTCAPINGMKVLLRGQVSVYEARGDMQLIVSYLEDAGEGALRREFERLKQKLAGEGLFDEKHKKPLPPYPATIGVISSTSGAALHDIRVTLNRRYPAARLVVYPSAVQGAGAAKTIAEMLQIANRRRDAQVLIVARGGGSLEDLQAFNDEGVARAIFASTLPVVSAVGHEVDYSISDMVADCRAPTPTAAAEIVAPDGAQLRENVHRAHNNLLRIVDRYLRDRAQHLDATAARLVHPLSRIDGGVEKLQALISAIGYQVRGRIDRRELTCEQIISRLRAHSPHAKLFAKRRQLAALHNRLGDVALGNLAAAEQKIVRFTTKVEVMNPHHTLARGYAILQDADNRVVVDAHQTQQGQKLTASIARGKLSCVVERVLGK